MNWDDLRYVLAIARSETLTGAARRLGVNQTTVSRRLDAIEEELGVRLFERTPSGLVPTINGNELLPDVEQIELLANGVERKVLGKDLQLSGLLRVTTIDVAAVYDNALFQSFSDTYPEVTLEVFSNYTPQNLTKREADIAIRWTNSPPEYLVGRKLDRFDYGLYAHQNIIDNYGTDFRVKGYPWLTWDDSRNAFVTKQWMKNNLQNERIVARVDNAVVMMHSVTNGLGVTFVPKIYASKYKDLHCIYDPGDDFSVDIWVLTHPDLRNTARVSAFMSHAYNFYQSRRVELNSRENNMKSHEELETSLDT